MVKLSLRLKAIKFCPTDHGMRGLVPARLRGLRSPKKLAGGRWGEVTRPRKSAWAPGDGRCSARARARRKVVKSPAARCPLECPQVEAQRSQIAADAGEAMAFQRSRDYPTVARHRAVRGRVQFPGGTPPAPWRDQSRRGSVGQASATPIEESQVTRSAANSISDASSLLVSEGRRGGRSRADREVVDGQQCGKNCRGNRRQTAPTDYRRGDGAGRSSTHDRSSSGLQCRELGVPSVDQRGVVNTEIRRLGRLSPVTDFLVCALDVIFCGRRAEIDEVGSIAVNPVSLEAQTLKILLLSRTYGSAASLADRHGLRRESMRRQPVRPRNSRDWAARYRCWRSGCKRARNTRKPYVPKKSRRNSRICLYGSRRTAASDVSRHGARCRPSSTINEEQHVDRRTHERTRSSARTSIIRRIWA